MNYLIKYRVFITNVKITHVVPNLYQNRNWLRSLINYFNMVMLTSLIVTRWKDPNIQSIFFLTLADFTLVILQRAHFLLLVACPCSRIAIAKVFSAHGGLDVPNQFRKLVFSPNLALPFSVASARFPPHPFVAFAGQDHGGETTGACQSLLLQPRFSSSDSPLPSCSDQFSFLTSLGKTQRIISLKTD